MDSSEERQVAIYIRKDNLAEIEKKIVTEILPAIPYINEENEIQIRRRDRTLSEVRNVVGEINDLKQINAQLSAKRVQKQRQCTNIIGWLKKSQEEILQLEKLIEQEEKAIDSDRARYEAKLKEIMNISLKYAHVYDKDLMKAETEKANKILSELKAEEETLRKEIDERNKILSAMKTDVPQNILEILDKTP